jgi:hypothetical protein
MALLRGGTLIALFYQIHLRDYVACSVSMNAALLVGKVQACNSAYEGDSNNRPSDVLCTLLDWYLKCIKHNC